MENCWPNVLTGEQEQSAETFPGDLYRVAFGLPGEEFLEMIDFAIDNVLGVKCHIKGKSGKTGSSTESRFSHRPPL
jgi:hypothetical protein